MKKIYMFILFIIILSILAFVVIWTNNENKNDVLDENEQSQDYAFEKYNEKSIYDLMKLYEHKIVEAINEKDFEIVSPYLVNDSNLYNLQKKLVKNLGERNIKENLIDFQIENIDYVGDKCNVYTYEKFNIIYGDKTSKIKEFYYIYQLQEDGSKLKLSDIFSNNKDIKSTQDNVGDGYEKVNISNINSNCENMIGNKVKFSGKIVYVNEMASFQEVIVSDGNDFVYTYFPKKYKVLKDQQIMILGVVKGVKDVYLKKNVPYINCDKCEIIDYIL